MSARTEPTVSKTTTPTHLVSDPVIDFPPDHVMLKAN
jgi:hypothetical protein